MTEDEKEVQEDLLHNLRKMFSDETLDKLHLLMEPPPRGWEWLSDNPFVEGMGLAAADVIGMVFEPVALAGDILTVGDGKPPRSSVGQQVQQNLLAAQQAWHGNWAPLGQLTKQRLLHQIPFYGFVSGWADAWNKSEE